MELSRRYLQYLLYQSVCSETWRSISIYLITMFREFCAIVYCFQDKCVVLSIDTYFFGECVKMDRYNTRV